MAAFQTKPLDLRNDKGTEVDHDDLNTIRPLKKRVCARYTEGVEKTSGGIDIPAVVLTNCKGNRRISQAVKDVKAGDQILFHKYLGSRIKTEDQDYLIIKEENILRIVES